MALNRKKKTVFQQVLYVNMIISFLFVCLFIFNYIYVDYKIKQGTKKYSEQIIKTMEHNFQVESIRLSTFLEMCMFDRSFVLALSNRLSTKTFIEYGKEVSEKISMIQYSLPYAENIYAYIKNNNKYILPQYAILDEELFALELSRKFSVNKDELPRFGLLENGFYVERDLCYYVYNCLDYGKIIIKINSKKFSGVNNINLILPNYDVVVLTPDNSVFATTSEDVVDIVGTLSANKESLYTKYNDTKYYVLKKELNNGFKFIILEKTSQMQELQQQNNVIFIVAGGILFLGCIVLIYLNTNIYRPLKKITSKLQPIGEKVNEIDFIFGKMNEIMNDNLQMQNQLKSQQIIQSDIELNYTIIAKQKISDELAIQLNSQYGKYRILSIAIQNQNGSGDEILCGFDDYLTDSLDCKPITVNQFLHSYIKSDCHTIQEIAHIIERYANNMKPNTLVFIGLSDFSIDFRQIHTMYRQSHERMMANHIPIDKRYALNVNDSNKRYIPARISNEIINTISNYALNGTSKEIQEIFENIFFQNGSNTLQDVKSYYTQLSGLLASLINQNNNVIASENLHSLHTNIVYNPVYMYYTLLEDYKKLNAGISKTHITLRYEIVSYINQHYTDPLSLDSISSVFGITPVYLSSWFKKNTGINLSVFISNIRMEEAKTLLLEKQQLKIADIAMCVGIPGTSTFIRQFKNYTGCTPDQYRQMNHKESN